MTTKIFSGALLLLALGCRGNNMPSASIDAGGPSGTHSWHTSIEGKSIPGLDEGACCYEGKLIWIWFDEATSTSSSGTHDAQGIRKEGRIRNKAGRVVAFNAHLPSATTGEAVIDGQHFDLANGRVFLVQSSGPSTVVKQLAKDLSAIEMKGLNFQKIGRDDPEIMSFFAPSNSKK